MLPGDIALLSKTDEAKAKADKELDKELDDSANGLEELQSSEMMTNELRRHAALNRHRLLGLEADIGETPQAFSFVPISLLQVQAVPGTSRSHSSHSKSSKKKRKKKSKSSPPTDRTEAEFVFSKKELARQKAEETVRNRVCVFCDHADNSTLSEIQRDNCESES